MKHILYAFKKYLQTKSLQNIIHPNCGTRAKLSAKERLKHLLSESGISTSRLASILALERSVGVRIVNGDRNLTLAHVRNLSKHFGLDDAFFV